MRRLLTVLRDKAPFDYSYVGELSSEDQRRVDAGDVIAKAALGDLRTFVKTESGPVDRLINPRTKGADIDTEILEAARVIYYRVDEDHESAGVTNDRDRVEWFASRIVHFVADFLPISVRHQVPKERKVIKHIWSLQGEGRIADLVQSWADQYTRRFMEAHDLGLVAGLETSDE